MVIDNEIKESNSIIMKNMISYIDKRIEKVKNNVILLSTNDNVNKLMTFDAINPEERNSYYYKLWNSLKSIGGQDEFIAQILIYFPDTDRDNIMGIDGLHNFDMFFNKSMEFVGLKLDDWRKLMSEMQNFHIPESYEVKSNYINSSTKLIPIILSLPYNSIPKAVIVVIIDERYINDIISNYNSRNKFYIIADKNGNIISNSYLSNIDISGDVRKISSNLLPTKSDNYHTIINGEKVSITYQTSSLTEWTYISAVPLEEISVQTQYIRKINMFVCAIFVILGFLISLWISSKMYRPVSTLVEYIDSLENDSLQKLEKSRTNEYTFINSRLVRIHSANMKLKDSLNGVLPFLHENLLYKILNGNLSTDDKIERELDKLQIKFNHNVFRVISIKMYFDGNDDRQFFNKQSEDLGSKIKNIVLAIIKQNFECYAVDIEPSMVSYIINSTDINEEDITKTCNVIRDYFNSEDNFIVVAIGIGNMCESISKLELSYKQSIDALNFRNTTMKSQIISFNEVLVNSVDKIFDLSLDYQKMYNALISGDFEEGLIISTGIFTNAKKRKVTAENLKQIYKMLINIPLSVLEAKGYSKTDWESEINIDMDNNKRLIDNNEYLNNILLIYKRIEMYITSRNKSNKENIIDIVTDYIKNNFSKDISLEQIANEINISTNYLSHFFKKMVGTSFPEYIKRLRIEKAKEKLKFTKNSIAEISTEVGYLNSNSFIKAFKEIEGISPGKYRELL